MDTEELAHCLRTALGAVFSADNRQGYSNNAADGLFAIAKALDGVANAIKELSAERQE